MLGFVFPGQGSQRIGMGRGLVRFSPAARQVFERAGEVLGFDLLELCCQGPAGLLTATVNAQPAIFTCSMAAQALLEERDVQAAVLAGHSVGELAALCAAGCLDFEAALLAVRRRGELMGSVMAPGAMMAIVGLEADQLEELCRQAAELGPVVIALHNSPTQLVISGARPAVERVGELARLAGALKVVPLAVSSAFHSPLMSEVVEEWAQYVAELTIRPPRVPVVLNTTARISTDVGEIRRELVEQLTLPVLWTQSVRTMQRQGVRRLLEVGDSKVLTGLSRQISREIEAISLENPAVINRLVAESAA
ncbi:MAG: ACP S-malonyltransferase [Desulfurispora sp.]|uniref:ACP S-malonyltransferase n=1 Tax=Desulfurispora sp. TaxID=3014275 RepID=UPI004049D712